MVNKVKMRLLPVVLGALVLLSGCAATRQVHEIHRSGENVALSDYAASNSPRMENKSFIVDGGFYAAKQPISVTPVNPTVALPPSFFKTANMDVQTPMAITEIGSRITKMTGLQVSIDQDVLGRAGQSSKPFSSGAPSGAPASPLPNPAAPPMSLPPLPVSSELSSATSDTVLQDVIYHGNLSGLLDEVTGRLNLSWRWTGQRVEIFRFETRMFRLNALAGKVSSTSKLSTTSSTSSGGGGGSSGAGGNSGNTGSSGSDMSVDSQLEIWKDVEDTIKSMMSSGDGSKLSVAPSAGVITVRDTPSVLNQIAAQVSEFNRIYSRQVTLRVEVYSVERSSGDNYGINWNALWATASNSLGFSITSAGNAGSGPAFTINANKGPFSGSDVVAKALSTMGNTTLLTSGTVTTLNGQTAPLNVSREQAYVQSTSTTQSGGESSNLASTTITPGVATEGFAMNFTPKILDNNQVLVRYSIDLSVIEAITTFTSPGGQSAVQLPTRTVRNFLQTARLPSGNTLVLTGFQQAQGTSTNSGPFNSKMWFAGGSKEEKMSSRTLVIAVTPYVTQ